MSTINIKGRLIDLSSPIVMGILNVTPDSFYAGSRKNNLEEFLEAADKMLAEGATILDIGGYSSRPGADDIPVGEEIKRITEPIREIKSKYPDAIISIDTFRAKVAEHAIEAGADIVNDISGGNLDEKMFELVASAKVPYIVMHMRGTPQNMKQLTDYDDLLKDIVSYFSEKINTLHKRGVSDVIIDPGFGFAKTISQNFELLSRFDYLNVLGKPLLAGLSRKSMIFRSLNTTQEQALNGTTVLNTLALQKGAKILRVHDVKPAMEVIKLLQLAKGV